jgi:anti-sigma B factor antagonist
MKALSYNRAIMADSLVVEWFKGDVAGQSLLCLKGPLTAENLPSFQHAIRREDSATVVMDFSDVPYIDSAGLGSLVSAYITRHKSGRRMALSGVNERILKLLEITNTEQLFLIFPTADSALEALTNAASA